MIIVFDLETQNLSTEVGGWVNVEAMRLAVAATFDERNDYRVWWEAQAADLIAELHGAETIVGFNVQRFDLRVLSLYGQVDKLFDRTFDILAHLHRQTGKRQSLNTIAALNLGEAKTASGIQAVSLFRTGRLDELTAYVQRDVELTNRLFEKWQAEGVLWVDEQNYALWPLED